MIGSTTPLGALAIIFTLGVILIMVRDVAFALWDASPNWLKLALFAAVTVAVLAWSSNLLR